MTSEKSDFHPTKMQINLLEEQPLNSGQVVLLVILLDGICFIKCHNVMFTILSFIYKLTCPYHSCGGIAGANTVDDYQGYLIERITLQSSVGVHQRPIGAIGRYDNGVAAIYTDIVTGWDSTHCGWSPYHADCSVTYSGSHSSIPWNI